jgi:hypothetical protein
MEGYVLSFLKAEWKVSDTGSAHWASSLAGRWPSGKRGPVLKHNGKSDIGYTLFVDSDWYLPTLLSMVYYYTTINQWNDLLLSDCTGLAMAI